MKKNDIVTINDGSFTRSVVNGKLIQEYLNCGIEKGKQYVVVEVGCSFPNTGGCNSFNNTTIQAIESGKIVFIEERFLELVGPTHMIMVDLTCYSGYGIGGETVEISDKLYKEIKKS